MSTQMNMGEMFMGKKMKLEKPQRKEFGGNWGRISEIEKSKYQSRAKTV